MSFSRSVISISGESDRLISGGTPGPGNEKSEGPSVMQFHHLRYQRATHPWPVCINRRQTGQIRCDTALLTCLRSDLAV